MMSFNVRKILSVGLMTAGVFLWPLCSRADSDSHSSNYGGNFGLGVEVGEPNGWYGVTGKFWIDPVNALQPGVDFNSIGTVMLQLDYLWHNFDLIRPEDTSVAMPLYIGIGGGLLLQNPVTAAVRVPLGISFIFKKWNVPVDFYFQIVPALWFSNRTNLTLYPELGAHFYL